MIPAVYLSHGAPPLVDDALWVSQLAAWAQKLPAPSAILVVSAHWAAAPLTIGSTTTETPLTYDFWGFPQHYYAVTYASAFGDDPNKAVRALAKKLNGSMTTRSCWSPSSRSGFRFSAAA